MDAFHTTADNSWGLEPLIDVGELATYLGIPVSTIYDWRTRGLGPPAYRFGIHLKFAVSDVRDWILYTDETPFVPVHSRLTFSESKAAICPVCHGKRLKPEALIKSLVAGPRRPPRQMCDTQYVPHQRKRAAAVELAAGVSQRLRPLVDLGLGYLSLSRTTPTLSGGELQRLRLATQLSSDLFGVVYILDEPSAGLHPQDVAALLGILDGLRGGEGTACSSSNTPWL